MIKRTFFLDGSLQENVISFQSLSIIDSIVKVGEY